MNKVKGRIRGGTHQVFVGAHDLRDSMRWDGDTCKRWTYRVETGGLDSVEDPELEQRSKHIGCSMGKYSSYANGKQAYEGRTQVANGCLSTLQELPFVLAVLAVEQ